MLQDIFIIDLAVDAMRGREGGDQCWAMQGPETVLAGVDTLGVIIPHAKTTPGGNERTSPT